MADPSSTPAPPARADGTLEEHGKAAQPSAAAAAATTTVHDAVATAMPPPAELADSGRPSTGDRDASGPPPEAHTPPQAPAVPSPADTPGHAEDAIGVLEFQGSVDSNNDLPSPETLKKIETYTVLDRHGKSRTFKSLYNSKHVARRVLIIFVRHFFCGNCQEYLRTVTESPITPARLLQLPVTTSIAIVGCGDPNLIDMYAAETKCQFPIYADPTRRLYEALGMVRTLTAGDRPYYAKHSLLRTAIESLAQGLRQIPKGLATKSGDYRQTGGEFLFEPVQLRGRADVEGWGEVDRQMEQAVSAASSAAAPASGAGAGGDGGGSGARGAAGVTSDEKPSLDGKRSSKSGEGDTEGDGKVEEKRVTWCHRMKTTRDHAEMPELMEVLGLGKEDPQLLLQDARSASFGDKEKKRWSRALQERKGSELSNLTREMGAMAVDK